MACKESSICFDATFTATMVSIPEPHQHHQCFSVSNRLVSFEHSVTLERINGLFRSSCNKLNEHGSLNRWSSVVSRPNEFTAQRKINSTRAKIIWKKRIKFVIWTIIKAAEYLNGNYDISHNASSKKQKKEWVNADRIAGLLADYWSWGFRNTVEETQPLGKLIK